MRENSRIASIDMTATGRNLKRMMLANGIAVKDVQIYLGLASPQSVYHWLEGKSLPTVDHLYALSDLFHIPMDELIKGNRKTEYAIKHGRNKKRFLVYYQKSMDILAG